jgi:hypothetical protein
MFVCMYVCMCVCCVCMYVCVCVCMYVCMYVYMSVENLNSTSYSDHDRYEDLPLQGKIPTVEPRIEPGTS